MNLSELQTIVSTANANSVAKTNTSQAQTSANTTQTEPGKDSYDSQLQEIAKKYDVTHMTLKQVAQMAYELNDKGLIDIGDFAVLARIGECGESDNNVLQIMQSDGTISLPTYWKEYISSVNPGDKGLDLFNTLFADRQETVGNSKTASANSTTVAQSSLPTTYRIAIDSSTRD